MIKSDIGAHIFERNRVGRVYSGGKLFADFFGDEAKDGFLPEEWIASQVKAINKKCLINMRAFKKLKTAMFILMNF